MRPGTDLTIVATAYMVHQSLEAADRLAAENVSMEVIDPSRFPRSTATQSALRSPRPDGW
ncbi:MAG: transketolase C-terminal domain-containing protein [Acidimicrobiia bacterium]